jgi:hypothetical protein
MVYCYLFCYIRTEFVELLTESPYVPKPLPSGVPISMCFCGDPCKVNIFEDETTYKQRYWMCSNFAWEPTKRQRHSTFIVRNCYY